MKKTGITLLACAALLAVCPAYADDERPSTAAAAATYNETRLSAQEEGLRELQGRVEQIEYALRRFEQTLQKMQTDSDARFAKLEAAQQQAASAAAAAPAPQTPAADPKGSLGALKMQGDKVTGGENKPESPPLPAVPADYGLTPQEHYEKAFNFLREGNFTEAEAAFKSFIEKNPKDKLLDNAKYWYGETLYVRGRYDQAAVAFAEAYQQNVKGAKAPDSLLKLGMSLGALKKTKDACVTLEELKTKYPKAAATIRERAENERAKLKCQAR